MPVTEAYRERILALSSFLYGPSEGPSFAGKVEALLSEMEGSLSAAGALRLKKEVPEGGRDPGLSFTESEALLITYGDMVGMGEGGESALSALGGFLQRRARPLFSHLHFLPFFPYSSDDGFSVIDYRTIDPELGTWEDVGRIGRDFKLAFDLVLNHGSVKSRWFTSFLAGTDGKENWYLTRDPDYDSSKVFRPRTHPLLTAFPRKDGTAAYVWTTFSPDQADFDFSVPEVLLEFISIFLEYAERGARIVRLDAIAFLWKEDGTSCLHHPKTHAVVKLLRSAAEALDLDVAILTETNVPHRENLSYWGKGEEAHMVYNFALPPLLLHAAVSGDAGPLRRWAAALPPPEEGPVFLNFTASHDGIGVGPVRGLVPEEEFAVTVREVQRRGGLVSFKSTPEGPVPYELNCVYADAVAPLEGDTETRARAFLATQAVSLALAGLPAVYFHSLIGSGNWKEGPETLGYNRAINRERPRVAELERGLADPASRRYLVYRGFSRLLEFRSRHPAFHSRSPQRILDAEGPVFALLRGPDPGGGLVLCAHNLSGFPAVFNGAESPLPAQLILEPWETRWIDLAGGESLCI